MMSIQYAQTVNQCIDNMKNTLQCEGMNIYQHGEMVSKYYNRFKHHIYAYFSEPWEGVEDEFQLSDELHKALYDFYQDNCESFMPP